MSPFEQAFPGFIKACADLHAALLPWGFALLVLAFAFRFWHQPVSPPDIVRFIIKLFVIVLLMANAHRLINDGQALVARWTIINVPARPEQVHQRFKDKLAEAQNAPQARERSFWSTLFSSNWFEAIIYAFLTLVSWLALALMYFVYSVQRAVLLLCWVLSSVLLPTIAIGPVSSLGLRHILRTIGIILWPLALALASALTDGLIGAATDQSFLANSRWFGWLGYGLQNLLAVTVIAVWIIVSTIVAPVMIQKLIAGTAGPATVLTGAASLVADTGLSAVFSRFQRSRFGSASVQVSPLTGEVRRPGQPPPVVASPFPVNPVTPWQPRPQDPLGEQQVRDIVNHLKRN